MKNRSKANYCYWNLNSRKTSSLKLTDSHRTPLSPVLRMETKIICIIDKTLTIKWISNPQCSSLISNRPYHRYNLLWQLMIPILSNRNITNTLISSLWHQWLIILWLLQMPFWLKRWFSNLEWYHISEISITCMRLYTDLKWKNPNKNIQNIYFLRIKHNPYFIHNKVKVFKLDFWSIKVVYELK